MGPLKCPTGGLLEGATGGIMLVTPYADACLAGDMDDDWPDDDGRPSSLLGEERGEHERWLMMDVPVLLVPPVTNRPVLLAVLAPDGL